MPENTFGYVNYKYVHTCLNASICDRICENPTQSLIFQFLIYYILNFSVVCLTNLEAGTPHQHIINRYIPKWHLFTYCKITPCHFIELNSLKIDRYFLIEQSVEITNRALHIGLILSNRTVTLYWNTMIVHSLVKLIWKLL